jgi:hypothetical protein
MRFSRFSRFPARRSSDRGTLDLLGAVVSCTCACHCVGLPLLLVALPTLPLGPLADERAEWAFLATSLLLGIASLAGGRKRLPLRRSRGRPVVLFVAGFAAFAAARSMERLLPGSAARGLLLTGAALIAGAHLDHRRCCRACCASAPDEPPALQER